MWIAIFAGMLIGSIVGMIYLANRMGRFEIINKIARGRKKLRILIGAGIILILVAVLYFITGTWNMMVTMIHFMVISLICDGAGYIINKIRKTKRTKHYIAGIAAIVITIVYLSVGWYNVYHVRETEYQLTTEKNIGIDKLRVVGIADSHISTTFGGEKFNEYIDRINAVNPDVFVIVGDYVDDDTDREDMIECCEALGRLKTTYGVFYVFGNHDKGYYGSKYRNFTADELVTTLTDNNVTVLQDEYFQVTDHLYILGRQDKGNRSRADIDSLMQSFTDEDYVIVLDHQPGDYEAEEAAGADLVISGHTHGGQFIPINFIGELTGANDMTYGYRRNSTTDFIVTSGISNWTFHMKTGCFSEYIIVDVNAEK